MRLAFLKRNKTQKKRFGIVGAISTAIDFLILFALHGVGIYSVTANFFSTGTAFCFSFFANRNYTFNAKRGTLKKQIALYFVFTFFGIWVLQPIIIWLVQPSLSFVDTEWVRLLIAKLLATGVTLVWNYLCYSKIVFKKHTRLEVV